MSTIISTPHAPAAIGPYSQGVRIGNLIYTAGQIAINPAVGKVEATSIEEQTHQVLKNLQNILQAGGSSLSQVIKTTVFIMDMALFARMNAVYAEYFPANPPARSTVQVSGLPLGVLVEIECVAVANE